MRGRGAQAAATETLIGQCAQWLTLDFESDRLARRWALLETEAVAGFDYFRMNDRERLGLPMGPEMAEIEKQLDGLFRRRKRLYRAITKMTPANLHEAASCCTGRSRSDDRRPAFGGKPMFATGAVPPQSKHWLN